MRLVFWNCNMAFYRKSQALMRLRPDIAVISECANPDILTARGLPGLTGGNCAWVGDNPNKGLGVFTFGDYRLARHQPHFSTLRYILPVRITGAKPVNLLAVWAQNASGGITRKHQLGPLRRALAKYRDFLSGETPVIGGDFNNNAIWDRPGWRINHMTKVRQLKALGLVSAYHEIRGEQHGHETTPTHYWRDRRKDGPTYHIDYAFLPKDRIADIRALTIGTFEDWCGSGLSDHVPITLDMAI